MSSSSGLFARVQRKLRRALQTEAKGMPPPAAKDLALSVPFAEAARTPAHFRIAVMIHLFHPELADEMHDFCKNVPAPCDLLVTTDTHAKMSAIGSSLAGWEGGAVDIRLVPNRGRDIAPKLTTFREDYGRYDLVLFLHSKKSDTVDWGDLWRHQIISSLCGSPETVASILTLFASDESLGMVAPKSLERIHAIARWGDAADAKGLAARMGVNLDVDGMLDFPAGSMFWARPAALAPLLDLGLTAEQFPEEGGQTGATPAHAIERLFYLVCELAGFRWVKVADPQFFADRQPLLDIHDIAALQVGAGKAGRCVSDTMVRKA